MTGLCRATGGYTRMCRVYGLLRVWVVVFRAFRTSASKFEAAAEGIMNPLPADF